MSESVSSPPGFLRRLAIAGVNLLTPLHTGLLLAYFVPRWLGRGDLWLVDALGYILPWMFAPTVLLLPAAVLRRSRVLGFLAAVPVALFLLTYGALFLPRLPVHTTGPTFTVLTYNVLESNQQVDRIAAAIEAQDPDVVGLHELEPEMAQALEERLGAQYPYRRFEPNRGLLSRYAILEYESFQLAQGEGEWAQYLVLDIDGTPVHFLNAHPRSPPLQGFHPFGLPLGIPTGFANQGRDADIRSLLARAEQIDGPLVVMGDFNLADPQPLYAALTERLVDSFRESGWGLGFTFTYFPSIGLPMWRIDYVFHSPDLVALQSRAGDYGGSDHRPLVAMLAFRASQAVQQ